jgi:hypothetical protein
MATRSRWPLVATACLAGCGPSTEEIGVAALVAMPVSFLAVALPPLALRRLREGPRVRRDDDLRPAQVGFAVSCLFMVLGFAAAASVGLDGELVGMAAFATASAGMLYGMIMWLIFDRRQERFGRFALPTLLVAQGLPAALFAFHEPLHLPLSHDAGQSFAFFVWVMPGYFFAPPLLFFAIAAGVLHSQRRKHERRSD